MIRFKSMSWAYAFSYGPNNYISFEDNTLTQLVGKNGHGKSSIPLILEEALFNKNSKGIKKANILNRHTSSKSYEITVNFDSGNTEYKVYTVRGSTQTVSLYENGVDISGHTSTSTYKLIEDILGFDHKTFCQIIYQSDAYSLEFLTSTDTVRKKFLIDLLNLTKYTEILDKVKEVLKSVQKETEIYDAKVSQCAGWLKKLESEDLVPVEPLPTVSVPSDMLSARADSQLQLSTIQETNKRIVQNNAYKTQLEAIVLNPDVAKPTVDIVGLRAEKQNLDTKILALEKVIKGTGPILTKCLSCGQPVDDSHKAAMLEEAKAEIIPLKARKQELEASITVAQRLEALYKAEIDRQTEWEKLHRLYDPSLPSTTINRVDLETRIADYTKTITALEKEYQYAITWNKNAAAKNSRIEVILSQKEQMEKDYSTNFEARAKLQNRVANLQLLVKAFSTSGLVAYKIECLVKDLEDIVNTYLLDMSDGRFQLNFVISSSDKLDVVITDNGKNIDINALSNGELARVNISTLLAIRKLMQALSDVRTNLLILDETVESLDVDGKDKLIEVLLNESHLNTILVSHGYTNPLLSKVSIIKENEVSRVEV